MRRLAALLLLAAFASACTPAPTATPTVESSPTVRAVPTVNNGLEANEGISEMHMFGLERGWGWAKDAGDNSRLVSTGDGGVTWADRSPAGTAYGQQGASFLDAEHAWLPTFDSGGNAGLVRTSDGGQTWTTAAAAAGPYTGYKFSSENDGVASTADVGAGNAYVRFYQTHDAGASWSLVPVGSPTPEQSLPEGTIHICNICGDTASLILPGTVIITHGDLAGDPQGAVRLTVTTDLGNTWTDLKIPLPSVSYDGAAVAPNAPVFFDEQHGVMPVHIFKTQDGTNYAYRLLALYFTSDGGQTWTAGASVSEDVQTYEPALDLLSATDAVAHCGDSLCLTHDAGNTWATVKPNIDFGAFGTERQLTQIDFIDLRTGWAVITNDDLFQLYRTTDGGATWNLLGR